jgi:hypothetical protein
MKPNTKRTNDLKLKTKNTINFIIFSNYLTLNPNKNEKTITTGVFATFFILHRFCPNAKTLETD